MIERKTFELIKSNNGHFASWAVWGDFGVKPNDNMSDLDVLDPDKNPALLDVLQSNVIMVGLNTSREIKDSFKNFHGPGPVHKVRYTFKDTPYYGAYMTDLIKNHIEVDSGIVLQTLKTRPRLIEENIRAFRQELTVLKSDRPILFAFGDKVHNLLLEHLDHREYALLVKLRHYSDRRKNKETYKSEVFECIREAGLPTGNSDRPINMTEKIWDVFVSYKSGSDQEAAFDLVTALENTSIKCWVAPRDVTATTQRIVSSGVMSRAGYDDAIPYAIERCRAMVVVVSSEAMESDHIKDEINLAKDARIPFFPVRVKDVPLFGSFKYHLGRAQWNDCFTGIGSERFLKVASEVAGFLGVTTREGTSALVSGGASSFPSGDQLSVACPTCSAPNPIDARFCSACGQSMSPMPAEKSLYNGPSLAGQLQQAFWMQLVGHLETHAQQIHPQKPQARHYLNTRSMNRKGFALRAIANARTQRIGVDLYIELSDAKQHFARLFEQKSNIEEQLGFTLAWNEMQGSMSVSIGTYLSNAPLDDKSRWPEYLAWMTNRFIQMDAVFKPLVNRI